MLNLKTIKINISLLIALSAFRPAKLIAEQLTAPTGKSTSIWTNRFCVGRTSIGFVSESQNSATYFHQTRSNPAKLTRQELRAECGRLGCSYFFPGKSKMAVSDEGEGADDNSALADGSPCREVLAGAHLVCSTDRRMVYVYAEEGKPIYKTLDHKQPELGRDSLRIKGGKLSFEPPETLLASFANGDITYQVRASIHTASPIASVTVLDKGVQIAHENCVFYDLNQELVNLTFADIPFLPMNAGQAVKLSDGRMLFISLKNAAILDTKTGRWQPISSAPRLNDEFLKLSKAFYPLPDGRVIGVGGESYLFDPATSKWERLPSLDRPVTGASVQLPDGRILMVFGAWARRVPNQQQYASTYSILDPQKKSWSTSTPIAFQDNFPLLGKLGGGDPYLISLSADGSRNVEIRTYSTSANSWSQPIPIPFVSFAKARNPDWGDLSIISVDDDTLMIIHNIWKGQHNSVGGLFNLKTRVSTPISLPKSYENGGSFIKLAFAHGAILALVESYKGDPTTMAVERYVPSTKSWVSIREPKSNFMFHSLAELPGGKVLLLGEAKGSLMLPTDTIDILNIESKTSTQK